MPGQNDHLGTDHAVGLGGHGGNQGHPHGDGAGIGQEGGHHCAADHHGDEEGPLVFGDGTFAEGLADLIRHARFEERIADDAHAGHHDDVVAGKAGVDVAQLHLRNEDAHCQGGDHSGHCQRNLFQNEGNDCNNCDDNCNGAGVHTDSPLVFL